MSAQKGLVAMGKRRNTAKTGDKKLYSSRNVGSAPPIDKKEEENHILLDPEQQDDDGSEENFDSDLLNRQNILDLGNDDDDSSDSEESSAAVDNQDGDDQSVQSSSSDSDDSSMDDVLESDPRNWGKSKASVYGADTADLELTDDKEDAFVEETAAREVQSSRFGEMESGDFELSDNDEEESAPKTSSKPSTSRSMTQGRNKLLRKMQSELLLVVSHFASVVADLESNTEFAKKTLWESEGTAESVGTTTEGQQYLLTRSMIQLSVALNTVMCILMKSNVTEISANDDHPVMMELKRCSSLLEKFDISVTKETKNILRQVQDLVKAGQLLGDSNNGMESESEQDDSESMVEDPAENASHDDKDAGSISQEEEDVQEKIQTTERINHHEARFGLRYHETHHHTRTKQKSGKMSDFGDLEAEPKNSGSLATAVNAIEQRSKGKKSLRKEVAGTEHIDDLDSGDEPFYDAEAVDELMEHEKDDDRSPSKKQLVEATGFYDMIQKGKESKKKLKKSMYEVAPKFPRVENEVEGERGISRTILKNRGLVAHKAKINRNPRVKKREQYRKAVIRRKGAIRGMRDDAERHQYDGEATGIKSRVSHSRKLAR